MNERRTCISGQKCQISGLRGEYLSGDLLIASTCGTSDGAGSLFANFGLASQTTASGSVATWSSAPITAAGGRYRLCWCSSVASCSVASDFISDMGELILLGPSPLDQHRTCVSGQTCEFDGFLGSQLSSLNKVLLADTCGVGAVSVEIASLAVTLGVSALVSWGSPLHIAGGVYRLCWCSGDSGGQSCYAADDFTTDVGSLTMIGVAPLQQEKTCISGLPCEIDGITGLHTSSSDRFLVLQTCGVSTIVEGFPGFGIFDETGSSGGLVSWGPISAAGGQYALCWCPGPPSDVAWILTLKDPGCRHLECKHSTCLSMVYMPNCTHHVGTWYLSISYSFLFILLFSRKAHGTRPARLG